MPGRNPLRCSSAHPVASPPGRLILAALTLCLAAAGSGQFATAQAPAPATQPARQASQSHDSNAQLADPKIEARV